MAEAPALTLGRTRDIPATSSREAIPTLATIGEVVINSVFPRAQGIEQDPQSTRLNYLIPTDRGNVRINASRNPLDDSVVVYYPTKIREGKNLRDARVSVTIGENYELAKVTDPDSKHAKPYDAPVDELRWLSGVLTRGDLQSALTHVGSRDKVVEEIDAPEVGI